MDKKYIQNKCGVYIIRNKVNGKFYIGSSKNIWNRWQSHKYELNNGIHSNKHLQRAWNKYREENFEFDVLEFCDEEIQFQREQEYIDKYWGDKNFYNENNIATCPPKQDNKGENHPRARLIYVYNKDGLVKYFYAVTECAKWLIENNITNTNSKNKISDVASYIRRAIKNNTLYKNLLFSYTPLKKSYIIKMYVNKELNKNNRWIEIIKNGESLGIFESSYELERQSEKLFGVKLLNTGIGKACRLKKKYKGFEFRYLTKREYKKHIREKFETS